MCACHDESVTNPVDHSLRRLTTPRAAALAGVLFALLFGTVLVLLRTALPAGGGEPGTALTAFLGAVVKKQWPAIKAGLSPKALPMFDKDYNSPAENAASAADLFTAWLPMDKLKVGAGQLVTPTVAVLEVEGERFGSPWMSLVRMVNTAGGWQFDQSAQAGPLR